MKKILVTGACGYIGSHTLVSLIENGYSPVSIDNLSRSHESVLDKVARITGTKVRNYRIDLTERELTRQVFQEEDDIQGVIHFAAFKSVPESVASPNAYHHNNVSGLINVLACVEEFAVPNFIFSSSCTVYGRIHTLPVNEQTSWGEAESPYARSKQIGEGLIRDMAAASDTKFVSLRYFNPVGAHESGLIGEMPIGIPNNLVPRITGRASGKYDRFEVSGLDYDTRDGSCIRDYVHVMDIAEAHVKALEFAGKQASVRDQPFVFNLGTGEGVSVLEVIAAFEEVIGKPFDYERGPRRPGDIAEIYSDSSKAARELGWKPERDLQSMMRTAWKWEQNCGPQVVSP